MDDERCSFPARAQAWPEARAFVERRCGELAVPRGAALRLELIAEELFINASEHGAPAGDARIWLQIRDRGDEVELVLEDRGPAFDPFQGLAPASASANPADRPVGGLGRLLVAGLCSGSGYARQAGVNRVTVAVQKAAGAARGRA